MAIDRERMLDIAGLEQRIGGLSNLGGFNFLGGGLPPVNIANILQQQGPQLGPDEFGSYTIPYSDPTYRSGFDYARSIAGGMPMSQVIAPGVSYSPEQPMGYTQEQLNLPKDVDIPPPPPPILPPTREPDDPSFLGTGIGGVRIPVDRDMKMPPLRDIFGGFQKPDLRPDIQPITPPIQTPPTIDIDAIRQQIAESGIDFGNLLGIPKIEQPDLSQFVRREDIPTLIPDVPTGRDFSVDREALIRDIREGIEIPKYEMPDLSQFARLEDMPTFDPSSLQQQISGLQQQFGSITPFDASALQQQIAANQAAIAGINIPTYQAPNLSAYDARIAELEQQLAGLQTPTGGRFSVDQQLPRGLF